MDKLNKVSFDFDGTLDKITVQNYASELIDKNIDVWICTLRTSPENSSPSWNDDLFLISNKLGISKDKIIFTNGNDKFNYLKDNDFIWHLDNDWIELKLINKNTKVIGISVFGNSNWKSKCNKLINKSISLF